MPLIALVVIGIAAGFLATRLMRVQTDLPTTIVIGVVGALIGGFVLRFLVTVGSLAFGLIGAVLGAMLLIWAYQYLRKG